MSNNLEIKLYPKYLWFLIVSYIMVIAFANWFDPRLVNIYGIVTDAGTLMFPLSFILSDVITEVYGYKHNRRAIWCGFLFNFIFVLYSLLVTHMPSPSFAVENNELFDKILGLNIRIIIASFVSYILSEPLDSYITAKLKILTNGRFMWLRFTLSTFFASGLDSFVFTIIAFYKVINNTALIQMIIAMWIIKLCIEIFGLPLSIWLSIKLKSIEKLDIYDAGTKFNIFSFDVIYSNINNKYYERRG